MRTLVHMQQLQMNFSNVDRKRTCICSVHKAIRLCSNGLGCNKDHYAFCTYCQYIYQHNYIYSTYYTTKRLLLLVEVTFAPFLTESLEHLSFNHLSS